MRPTYPLKLAILLALLIALLLPALPAAAAPDYQGGIHVVQRGETLSQIARRYGVSMAALAQANGISNPNFIYSGQRLTIPGASGGASSGGSAASGVHVVRAGENLSSIAARYGVTVAALARANGIANPNHIYVGQRLAIGSGGAAAAPPAASQPAPSQPAASSGRWIDINLSSQTLTAYEGSSPVFSTLVSTGSTFATPVGTYSILYHVQSQRMTGPGYDLPNVPWVMYFTNRGHAIHGAYWHNNFGQPMSHGCVNMRPEEARWLYEFTPNGAQVVVHY
ncbi:MAG TPA: LysM peptidoglycan-binding domain-containing protein [Anaerolineae bacterium]|nr:LysM peptidoglycan-binding domain-containing protein [Anaerolineae bacterium]HNU05035.1 LysM peptidoglycan-binding domain-containing protein [Anaerolineae bacterium]